MGQKIIACLENTEKIVELKNRLAETQHTFIKKEYLLILQQEKHPKIMKITKRKIDIRELRRKSITYEIQQLMKNAEEIATIYYKKTQFDKYKKKYVTRNYVAYIYLKTERPQFKSKIIRMINSTVIMT